MAATEDACRSCHAPVIRLDHERTGNEAPIDRDPTPDGNIAIDLEAGTYRIVPKAERDQYVGQLRKNHFATCPQAEQWHRTRRPAS